MCQFTLELLLTAAVLKLRPSEVFNPQIWNIDNQKAMGKSDYARSINKHFKTLEQNAYEIYREMLERKMPLTAQAFKDRLNGIKEEVSVRMLIPIFQEHNRQMEALIGKEYAPATAIRYQTTLKL